MDVLAPPTTDTVKENRAGQEGGVACQGPGRDRTAPDFFLSCESLRFFLALRIWWVEGAGADVMWCGEILLMVRMMPWVRVGSGAGV